MADLALIKKLREATSCGIADCNKALTETNNNIEEAIDWLRKKGLSSAAKKGGRITTEGLIGIHAEGNKASIVEVNSETDFVAKNDKFQAFVQGITQTAFENNSNDVESLKEVKFHGKNDIVKDELANNIAVIGENLNIRRVKTTTVDEGIIATYLHNVSGKGLGRIGVLLSLKSSGDKEKLQEFGKKIAMHIAATKPEFLNIESVSKEALEREKAVFAEQARNSGKPENIIEKMIEGRIRKYYDEVVLLEQFFVMDDKKKIKEVVETFTKELGTPVSIEDYTLYILGEGIEKKSDNFAEEVASMTK
jgi:elongation factor Ts